MLLMRYIASILWLPLTIIDLMVSALAYPLAPFIVLSTTKDGISPFWSWPWLTPDNPIDGDAGHLARWAGKPVSSVCLSNTK